MSSAFATGCDVVTLTQALVRQGALSGAEGPVAKIVIAAMQALGYDEIRTDRLGNVVGLCGPADAPVALLFDGHMDVVPAPGDWSRDPFSGALDAGHVHGRGTTDMKGPLAAAICGVAAAARQGGLTRRVAVSASVMEEVIEGAALAEVLDAFTPEMVVICEPSDLEIKIAQRGCVELIVQIAGIPAHAAFPERGVNAVELAARGLLALSELEMPRDPLLGRMVLVPTDIISTPHPSVSALPSSVTIRYDRRTGIGETATAIRDTVQECLDRIDPAAFRVTISEQDYTTHTGEILRLPRDLPAWHTPESHSLVVAAQACLAGAGLSTRLGTYDFCTNGSEAAGRRELPTIGLGPGRPDDAHVIDEAIAVDMLHKAETVYAALARHFAAPA